SKSGPSPCSPVQCRTSPRCWRAPRSSWTPSPPSSSRGPRPSRRASTRPRSTRCSPRRIRRVASCSAGIPRRWAISSSATPARPGEPVLLVTAAQLPYIRSLAAPLAPVPLPSSADRARDRIDTLGAEIERLVADGAVDAELALLSPLFERFDPAEVAAALLALRRQTSDVSQPAVTPAPTWTRVFVNVGKKDRVAAKDLVGALIREVGLEKNHIGRIDVRDTFTLLEV